MTVADGENCHHVPESAQVRLVSYASEVARIVLGVVLLSAATSKARRLERFASSLPFAIAPQATATFARMIVAVEFALGIALVIGLYWRVAALLSSILMGAFAVFVRVHRSDGQPCGCGGIVPEELSTSRHVALNVALCLAGVFVFAVEVTQIALPLSSPFVTHQVEGVDPPAMALAFAVPVTLGLLGAGADIRRASASRRATDEFYGMRE